MPRRILILSWEYPPIVEGGLARHVRKLSEGLVARDVAVHVLTRGNDESPRSEVDSPSISDRDASRWRLASGTRTLRL